MIKKISTKGKKSFFDLSSKDQKKIVKKAVIDANKEQLNLIRSNNGKLSSCGV